MATRYDVLIIGAGMGGLSSGAFLAKEGKSVLILEKHDRPGGYVTSFTRARGGYTFDCAIFHLTDMGEGQTIPQFIRYWGEEVQAMPVHYRFRNFIGSQEYVLNSQSAQQDLIRYFPEEAAAIRKFFSLSARIMDETYSQGAPKPPYEMNWLEKIRFGVTAVFKRPLFLRYATRDGVEFLEHLFKSKRLASLLWSYYPLHSLIFFAYVFGWETAVRGQTYYYYNETSHDYETSGMTTRLCLCAGLTAVCSPLNVSAGGGNNTRRGCGAADSEGSRVDRARVRFRRRWPVRSIGAPARGSALGFF